VGVRLEQGPRAQFTRKREGRPSRGVSSLAGGQEVFEEKRCEIVPPAEIRFAVERARACSRTVRFAGLADIGDLLARQTLQQQQANI